MEELIDISKSLLRDTNQPDASIARVVAEWALPGDMYNDAEARFERSGLSLKPFVDLVSLARRLDMNVPEKSHELCI